MNLDRAFDQFLSGTTDLTGTSHGSLGTVKPVGWDFGEVAQGATNDYLINGTIAAGETLTATLSWFRDRTPFGEIDFLDQSFDNLDLELSRPVAGSPVSLISESLSRYNNTEHFEFKVPTTGSTCFASAGQKNCSTSSATSTPNIGLAGRRCRARTGDFRTPCRDAGNDFIRPWPVGQTSRDTSCSAASLSPDIFLFFVLSDGA